MNGLKWLSSNCGAKNRPRRIPLDKSVCSCEAERKSLPQFWIVVKPRQASPRRASLITRRDAPPRFPDETQMDFIFLTLSLVHTRPAPAWTSVNASFISSPIADVPFDRRTSCDRGSERPWLVQNETLEKWQIRVCGGARGRPELLAVPTTSTLSRAHWGSVWAVGLTAPWARGGTRDPRAVHRVVTLSERCTADVSRMMPSARITMFFIRCGSTPAICAICSVERVGCWQGQRSGGKSPRLVLALWARGGEVSSSFEWMWRP